MYSNFDSMPPRTVDNLEIPYPLSYYKWVPNLSSTGDISITIREEFSPLVNKEYRYVANTLFHGLYSLMIEDTLNNSFTYATHKFPKIENKEFMVEFYIWVNKVDGNLILYEPLSEGKEIRCHLALVSDSISNYENELIEYMEFEIRHQEETNRLKYRSPVYRILLHNKLDTLLFFWHKIQLHHHINEMVSLWVDGDSLGSFFWSKAYNITDFLIGTKDGPSNGEIFFDDFIVTTSPEGKHPRLWFDEAKLHNMSNRINDTDTLPIGISYRDIFERLKLLANTSHPLLRKVKTPSFDFNDEAVITKASMECSLFVSLFEERIFPDAIIETLPNWKTWGIHNLFYDWWYRYVDLGMSNITELYTVIYDFYFDHLSDYDRMNIQDAILVLGVNQIWLLLYRMGEEYPIYGGRPPVNYFGRYMGPVGLFGLVVDDEVFTSRYIDKVKEWGLELLNNSSPFRKRIDPVSGITHEGTVYNDNTLVYPLSFFAGYSRIEPDIWDNNSFSIIKKLSTGLLHLLIPKSPASDKATRDFVSFSDVGGTTRASITSLFFLSHFYKDSLAQWILKRTNSEILKKWGTTLECPLMQFIYAEKNVPAVQSDSSKSLYYPNNGWYTMRTGWDSTDVLIAFKCGKFGSHQHNTNNHFVLGWKNYWIVPDAENLTSYGGSPYASYHNTLTNHSGDSLEKFTWSNFWRRGKLIKHMYNDTFGLFEGYIDGRESLNQYYSGNWIRKGFLLNDRKTFLLYDYAIHYGETPISWMYRIQKPTRPFTDYFSDNDNIKFVNSYNYVDTFEFSLLYPLHKKLENSKQSIILKYDPPEQREVEFINAFYPRSLVKPKIERLYGINSRGATIDNYIIAFSEKTDTSKFSEYTYKNNPAESMIHILPDLMKETEYYYIVRNGLNLIDKRKGFTDTTGLLKFSLEQIDLPINDSITIDVSTDIKPPGILYNPPFDLWGRKLAAGGRYPNLFYISDDLSGNLYYNVYYSSISDFDTLMKNVGETPYSFTLPETSLSDIVLKVQAFDRMFNQCERTLEDTISIGPLFCTRYGSFRGNNQRKTGFTYKRFNLVYEVNKSIILSDSLVKWRNRFIDYGSSPSIYIYNDTIYIIYLNMDRTDTIKMASINRDSGINIYAFNLDEWINPDFDRYLEPPSFLIQNDTIYTLIGSYGWKRLGQERYIQDYDVVFGRIPLDDSQNSTWENKAHYEKYVSEIDTSCFGPSIINDLEGNLYLVWSSPPFVDTREIFLQYRNITGWSQIYNLSSSPDVPSYSPCINYCPYGVDIVWIEGEEIVRRTLTLREEMEETEVIGKGSNPEIIRGNFIVYEKENYIIMSGYDGFEWNEINRIEGNSPHVILKDNNVYLSYVKQIGNEWTKGNGWKIETKEL